MRANAGFLIKAAAFLFDWLVIIIIAEMAVEKVFIRADVPVCSRRVHYKVVLITKHFPHI